MKQIKDVEKLKDRIDDDEKKLIKTYGISHEHMISKVAGRCKMLADELAVEVPEAEPGAIEKALKTSKALAIWHNSSEVLSEIESAGAELAQLQAERDSLIETCKDRNYQITCLQIEVENLRGALRTLAIFKSHEYNVVCRKDENDLGLPISCQHEDCLIAYALANPTKEEA